MRPLRNAWTLVVLALVSVVSHAQPLTDRLPGTTLVYLGWSPNASLQTTATAKMLADERFMGPWRKVFQEFILEMPDGMDGGEKLSEHIAPLLMDAAQCEGCFALLELKQGKRHFNPQSVLMIDLGAKRKSFEEHFKPIQLRMKERIGERLQMTKLEKSWVWTKPDREGKPALTWGYVGDTFIVFFGDGAEDFVPRLVKGQFDSPLKTAPAFADTLGKLPGDSIFTTFLDTKGSLNLVRRLIEREGNSDMQMLVKNWEKVLGETGLANVKGIGEKTTIEDRQFVTRTLLRTEGAPRGLMKVLTTPAVDDAMLKLVPADSMAAAAMRLDLAKAYADIKESLITIGGDEAKRGFEEMEQGAQGLGLLIKDVLEPFGDQWVIYNAASQGGFALTGWTMIAEIRDEKKFNRTLNTVRGMIAKAFGDNERVRIREFISDGQRIEYVEYGRWGAPFAPAWAVVGNKFVMSMYPQIVEDAARHIRDGGKSILDNPDFVAARKRTGGEGPLVWMSGPEVTRNLYPIGLFVVNLINSFGGSFDGEKEVDLPVAQLLPPLGKLLTYVGNDCLSVKATQDGVLKTRTVGNPLLSPLAWMDSPVLWLALGIPTMGSAEEAADRNSSLANVRQIGQAIMLHQSDKGKYPPDLDVLVKAQHITLDQLKSPYGPSKDGKDYILVGYPEKLNPATSPDAGQLIIAYDQAALEQGEGTAVVFADGHGEWLPVDGFKRAQEESRKKASLLKAEP